MTLLITLFPSIIILFYFICSDKFKEPKRVIIEVFLLGIVITIPATIIDRTALKGNVILLSGNNNQTNPPSAITDSRILLIVNTSRSNMDALNMVS